MRIRRGGCGIEMAKITIDGQGIEVPEGSTVLEAAQKLGIEIPTLCNLEDIEPRTSCMVCLVKDLETDEFVPACGTVAFDGAEYESQTNELADLRREALELLLGDHLGDCEAPCRLVHPAWLDLPRMIHLIEAGDFRRASAIASRCGPFEGEKLPP